MARGTSSGTGRTTYRATSRPRTSTPSSTSRASPRTCARRSPPGPAAHWVFVSTINVYADNATPDPGTDGPLVDADRRGPRPGRGPRGLRPDEGLVRERGDRRRRALDGGPARADRRAGRPDRPLRLLARAAGRRRPGAGPANPEDRVQFIDVRDLAEWIVRSVENGTTGVYDGIGPATPAGDVLAQTADGRRRLAGAGVDRSGVPDRAEGGAVDGRRRRCRCGCRGRSTTG